MLQEVKLMKLVQHPNVVRLYEVQVLDLTSIQQRSLIISISCFIKPTYFLEHFRKV